MDDLVQFLRARYDETAANAEAARGGGDGRWHQDDAERYPGRIVDSKGGIVTFDEGAPDEEQAKHIVRHDPAHALADVDAKRAVVDAYEQAQAMKLASADNYKAWVNNDPLPHPEEAEGTEEMKLKVAGLSQALRLLALPYADHPDYREEWRP